MIKKDKYTLPRDAVLGFSTSLPTTKSAKRVTVTVQGNPSESGSEEEALFREEEQRQYDNYTNEVWDMLVRWASYLTD